MGYLKLHESEEMTIEIHEIDNNELKASDIPEPNATWCDIERFTLTFDGYEAWGSFEKCSEVALKKRHDSLIELRTCLFFQQRQFRFRGYPPDDEEMLFVHSLVERIREYVIE